MDTIYRLLLLKALTTVSNENKNIQNKENKKNKKVRFGDNTIYIIENYSEET